MYIIPTDTASHRQWTVVVVARATFRNAPRPPPSTVSRGHDVSFGLVENIISNRIGTHRLIEIHRANIIYISENIIVDRHYNNNIVINIHI